MKRLTILFLLLTPFLCFAQSSNSNKANDAKTETVAPTFPYPKFIFLPNAHFTRIVDKEYIDYFVFETPGYSQSELYKKILLGISLMYPSPEDVITTKIENELIIIKGVTPFDVEWGDGGVSYWAFKYTIKFLFQDGKIRVDAPTADEYRSSHYSSYWQPNVEKWMKVQENYIPIRKGIEPIINTTILRILNESFDKKEW